MLRRRPRRTAPSWVRHPAVAPLFLATLYLAATVVNVLLAITMNTWWPAVFATLLALVTVLCATAAWRRLRRLSALTDGTAGTVTTGS
ncbi:hypothetical protein [Actinophytocola algeriensis]|uniref:Membrane protein implicated in regulation of membrane protease activity n=1 Tax=Actinophytocola algeriensis TaxID=1768010 RepID=A0A7W7QET9_9PSEU|nr:hypothetical protein [Actinophytocola algeriensis]MBB4912143.1 membrane protein implicated in regulation of membrane protease activity [Actinophytocola algeriensis]MBE1477365.1 membrane protein implicated in regulation of membrane protease activity [Actinophytocola algeriensis]